MDNDHISGVSGDETGSSVRDSRPHADDLAHQADGKIQNAIRGVRHSVKESAGRIIEMMNAEVPALGYELNPFLFASIGSESGGTQMSVLSALLKINVDPWREAAELAKLPQQAAADRLSGLIAKLGEPAISAAAGANSLRLVALLPKVGAPQARRRSVLGVDWPVALCLIMLTAIVAVAVMPVLGR